MVNPQYAGAALTRDRLAIVLLAAVAVAFWFSSPQFAWAPAAWLAPILLVRFLRGRRVWVGFLIGFLVTSAVSFLANREFQPLPAEVQAMVAVVAGLIGMLPYLADRLAVRPGAGFAATLVLPAAATTLEYASTTQYVGTINSIAYTQTGLLPLAQSAALTSIWAIVFLLYWAAAVVNWAWDRRFAWPRIRWGVVLYASLLLLTLAFGAARLVLAPPPTPPVPMSAISVDPLGIGTAAYKAVTGQELTVTASASVVSPETMALKEALNAFFAAPDEPRFAPVRAEMARLHDDLLSLTEREARGGARIVAWAEGNAYVLKADEAALIQRAQQVARAEEIYLFVPLATYSPGVAAFGGVSTVENKVLAIGPDGAILATYLKTKLPPGDPSVPGDGVIPVLQTPYGRIAMAICSDLDSPDYVAQVSRAGADLLVAPASDWQAIQVRHADSARLRAIENGVTLLRPTLRGSTLVVDPWGRVLAEQDWFASTEPVLAVAAPIQATPTLYARSGDVVAWASVAGLAAAALVWLLRRALHRFGGRPARPAAPIAPGHV